MYPKPLRTYNLIVILAALLLFVNHTQARDVPLPTKHTIDDAIDEPQAIYPADMDGDGAIDLIGAATADNTIARLQNVKGDGSAWTILIATAIWMLSPPPKTPPPARLPGGKTTTALVQAGANIRLPSYPTPCPSTPPISTATAIWMSSELIM